MSALTIDTDDFTRRGDSVSGRMTLEQLPRLRSVLVADEGGLAWSLDGSLQPSADGGQQRLLQLRLEGSGMLACGRCLAPVQVPIAADRRFKLVATEAEAEREDADEDRFDVLVRSRRFDLHALIEDEAIMALPVAPRHASCVPPLHQSADPQPAADEHPFARLASLRRRTDRDT
jgi:uncharacterized protein